MPFWSCNAFKDVTFMCTMKTKVRIGDKSGNTHLKTMYKKNNSFFLMFQAVKSFIANQWNVNMSM
jgi:hypothetical protein